MPNRPGVFRAHPHFPQTVTVPNAGNGSLPFLFPDFAASSFRTLPPQIRAEPSSRDMLYLVFILRSNTKYSVNREFFHPLNLSTFGPPAGQETSCHRLRIAPPDAYKSLKNQKNRTRRQTCRSRPQQGCITHKKRLAGMRQGIALERFMTARCCGWRVWIAGTVQSRLCAQAPRRGQGRFAGAQAAKRAKFRPNALSSSARSGSCTCRAASEAVNQARLRSLFSFQLPQTFSTRSG